ncbi:Protein SVP26 [Hypsizygus marmoreus]|uniref:Protein SVP26 n=1 Tax=Hypsizygus marmoreus TaxID=39966 RepID=A0A369JFN6_HYPMA|nr:Protein SVP26 [Hypsizygus marmoreus]
MGLLYYISYVAVLAAFAFVTLSLASGLLYVSELIEEHSRLAKVYGQRGIYAIIALHVILYFSESLPFAQTAFSITCHLVYLQNFSVTWPIISLTSPSFIASCLFVISDHFLWFFYFARITQEARHHRTYRGPAPDVPGFTEIASFFGMCVWLAPLFLFLSLSANDNALPVSAGTHLCCSYGKELYFDRNFRNSRTWVANRKLFDATCAKSRFALPLYILTRRFTKNTTKGISKKHIRRPSRATLTEPPAIAPSSPFANYLAI